jgi:hypothetical protein
MDGFGVYQDLGYSLPICRRFVHHRLIAISWLRRKTEAVVPGFFIDAPVHSGAVEKCLEAGDE